MAMYMKIRGQTHSELVYVWLSEILLILMSVVIKSWALVFYNNESYNSCKSQFVYIGSMRHSYIVIVIGWKILQSIIGSIGWDTIDNFPIINRIYIKNFIFLL